MVPDNTILLEILRDACRAPSGDNVQPWRFRWDGSTLSLYNIPDIHNPYLDFEERGAYIAHGALLENLAIAAPHYGYNASITLFPDLGVPDLVACIAFAPSVAYDDPLYTAISKRATNRRPYASRALTSDTRVALRDVAMPKDITLILIEDTTKKEALAPHISAM